MPLSANPVSDEVLAAALTQAGLELLPAQEHMSQRIPALLMHAALLHDFHPEEVDVLCARMLHVRAQPGQVLIAEGDTHHWMMLLFTGTVDVTKRSPRTGEPSRLAVIQRGAAIGEMSMFDGEMRYASCTAIEQVEAGVLSRAAVGALIRDHPAIGAKLMVKLTQLLAQRLRNTSNQLIKAMAATEASAGG